MSLFKSTTNKVLMSLIFSNLLFIVIYAKDINASSGSTADLQTAVDNANDGDVVVIPAGTFNFDGTVTLKEGVSLRGAGKDSTRLVRVGTTHKTMIRLYANKIKPFTISAIAFEGIGYQMLKDDANSTMIDTGLAIYGKAKGFLIKDCLFTKFSGHGIYIYGISAAALNGHANGVIANNEFINIYYQIATTSRGYGVGLYGDDTWQSTLKLGTSDAVFIEDNLFKGNRHCIAGNMGCRYVFRHNTVINNYYPFAALDAHGKKVGDHGTRSYEIYNNTITGGVDWSETPHGTWAIGLRGGDGVVYNNTFSGMSRAVYLIYETKDSLGTNPDYPVPDQIRDLWLWNNTFDSNPMTSLSLGWSQDQANKLPKYFQENRDYHFAQKSNYKSYQYPHPLRSAKTWSEQLKTTSNFINAKNTAIYQNKLELARIPNGPVLLTNTATAAFYQSAPVNNHEYAGTFPQTKGSLQFWIKGDVNTQLYKNIFDGWDTTRNHIFIRSYKGPEGGKNCQIAFYKPGDSYRYATNFNLINNQWNFIILEWNLSTGLINAYLNNELINTRTITDTTWRPTQQKIQFNSNFTGEAREARITNYFLTVDEKANAYAGNNFWTSGTAESNSIQPIGTAWGIASWDKETPLNTSIKIHVKYYSNENGWQLIPDSHLPGNALGFNTNSIDLSSLNHDTYFRLRFSAKLSTSQSTVTPKLISWRMNWQPLAHPRLYVDHHQLADIRQKVLSDEFSSWYNIIKANRNSSNAESAAISAALIYLIEENNTAGREAIDKILPVLKASTDARVFDMPMHKAACIYDWCYPLLTTNEKNEFMAEFIRLASSHTPNYPAHFIDKKYSAVVGHVDEGWLMTDQIPAGIAIYDENQIMFDKATELFLNEFVPVRNYYYKGHATHQGDSYGPGRFVYDQAASWSYRSLGWGDVLSREQQYLPYHTIYNQRPDKLQFKRGDTYDNSGRSGRKKLGFMLCATYYKDPYLMTKADSDHLYGHNAFDQALHVIMRSKSAIKKDIAELPKIKYFQAPIGEMTFRTGWELEKNSNDTAIYMRLGDRYFGNHQRPDFGVFQIYHKGILAMSSGLYEGKDIHGDISHYGKDHWVNYHHNTISMNGLLINDPNETFNFYGKPKAYDGGQGKYRHPIDAADLMGENFHFGEITSHAFDATNSSYAYISGEITKAYSNKVSLVTRSMLSLKLNNNQAPVAFIVFDRINNKEASFKKTWLIHSIQEPTINGKDFTIVRDQDGYAGKLKVKCLSPSDATITKVGGAGKEFWLDSTSTNYWVEKLRDGAEPGAWRIEISPPASRNKDLFLNVMTVMDNNQDYNAKISKLETNNFIGTTIDENYILFSKEDKRQADISFTSTGDGQVHYMLFDLKPGVWQIKKEGIKNKEPVEVKHNEHHLLFQDTAGSFELTWLADTNEKPFAQAQNITTLEDQAITITLNATDSDGDTLTYSIISTTTNGSLSNIEINQHLVTYQPTLNFNGLDEFTFSVDDGKGGISEAIIDINVTPVNDNPLLKEIILSKESIFVNETFSSSAQTSDIENDAITYLWDFGDGNTSTEAAPTHQYLASGNFTIQLSISDGNGGTATANANVAVEKKSSDNPNTFISMWVFTETSKKIPFAFTQNDEALTYKFTTPPTKGSLLFENNAWNYSPHQEATGTDSITYTIESNSSSSDPFTLEINLVSKNNLFNSLLPINGWQYQLKNDNNILIKVPSTTDATKLPLSFHITDANISAIGTIQVSGVTKNDFTQPVEYTTTYPDGLQATTIITIRHNLKSVFQESVTVRTTWKADFKDNELNISVPANTDLTQIILEFKLEGATIKIGNKEQVSGETSNDFTIPLTYTVTFADGTTENILVTVNPDLDEVTQQKEVSNNGGGCQYNPHSKSNGFWFFLLVTTLFFCKSKKIATTQ